MSFPDKKVPFKAWYQYCLLLSSPSGPTQIIRSLKCKWEAEGKRKGGVTTEEGSGRYWGLDDGRRGVMSQKCRYL